MRTSISMIALAALSAAYDYCQSLGHDPMDGVWIMSMGMLWALGFVLSVVHDFQAIGRG